MRLAVVVLLMLVCAVSVARADPLAEAEELIAKQEFERARELLRPIAEAGGPAAQFMMWEADAKDRDWLDLAFKSSPPTVRLQHAYTLIHTYRRCDDGLKWLKQTYEEGYPPAGIGLAELYLDNGCLHFDEVKGVALLEEAMRRGFSEAAVELGKLFVYGKKIASDDNRAIKYFQQAEALGTPKSKLADELYWTARTYLRGNQVKLNIKLGHFYHEWAQRLDPSAEKNLMIWHQLGGMYLRGERVRQDAAKGYGYLARGYEMFPTPSEASSLADEYLKPPPGIAPNYVEAQRWLLKCAGAQKWCRRKIGELLVDEKAAKQGLSGDLVEAYMWLTLGALDADSFQAEGARSVREMMQAVEARLSPAQRQEAKRRAEEWARTNSTEPNAAPSTPQ